MLRVKSYNISQPKNIREDARKNPPQHFYLQRFAYYLSAIKHIYLLNNQTNI